MVPSMQLGLIDGNPVRWDDAVVGHIAADERLVPGEVISLGTLAGCCGLEIDRFPQPGDTVRLELDGIGSITNEIAA